MDAVHLVVGRHHGPHIRLFHRSLERRQIDLVQRPLVDLLVDAVALVLLIIGVKMLDRGNHALALHALDVSHAQPGRQKWILAIALKVAAPQRHPVDVHRRPQNHVPAQRLHLLPNRLALALNQLRVPCGSHRHARRKTGGQHRRRRIGGAGDRRAARPRPHPHRPIGHLDRRDAEPFNGRRLHPPRPRQHGRLFLDCHAAHQVGYSLVGRQAGIFVRRVGRNGLACKHNGMKRGCNNKCSEQRNEGTAHGHSSRGG